MLESNDRNSDEEELAEMFRDSQRGDAHNDEGSSSRSKSKASGIVIREDTPDLPLSKQQQREYDENARTIDFGFPEGMVREYKRKYRKVKRKNKDGEEVQEEKEVKKFEIRNRYIFLTYAQCELTIEEFKTSFRELNKYPERLDEEFSRSRPWLT